MLSVRNILEKLKSLCSLRRLHMAPVEEAGETASSTREQGRALSAETEAGARGTFGDTWQGGSKNAAPFWQDEGGPDSLASVVEDKIVPRRRQAKASPQTLRFEALSLGKSPTTSLSLASLNLTFNMDIQIERTRTVDLCTNLVAGVGCAHAESADGSFAVHSSTSESVPWGTLGIGLDQELHPKKMKYIRIDTGARAVQISKVDLVLRSGPTGVDPSQTRFCQLLSMRTKMVVPGAPEIVLYLANVALADGASVFIASDTGASTVSPTGGVAVVRPVILSVVALDSGELTEDLLFPNVGSTSDVSSDMAFSLNERIAASTTGSKMFRVMAYGMRVAVLSGQSDRVTVLAPGSGVPVDPTADSVTGAKCPSFQTKAPFWTWTRPSL